MSFPKRFLLIASIVIALTDLIMFYVLEAKQTKPTLFLVILIIVVTIIPIAVNLWFWVPKYKLKW